MAAWQHVIPATQGIKGDWSVVQTLSLSPSLTLTRTCDFCKRPMFYRAGLVTGGVYYTPSLTGGDDEGGRREGKEKVKGELFAVLVVGKRGTFKYTYPYGFLLHAIQRVEEERERERVRASERETMREIK